MRFLLVLPLVLLGFACKQGDGGRCQVNDDCEPPLECSQSEPRVCRLGGSDDFVDGGTLPDSRFDAREVDANLSPIDAAPTFDAPPALPDASELDPDAAEPDAAL